MSINLKYFLIGIGVLDRDEILHQHPPQSQKMSTTINADEVITSSVTDLVCYISSISSNARYSHPEVDKDLRPGRLLQSVNKEMEIC